MTAPDKIDLAAIRVGDEVTILAKVTEIKGECLRVLPALFVMDHGGQWTDADHIASHTPAPKPLTVGDRVKLARGECVLGDLVALSPPYAWIKDNTGTHYTQALSDLERAQ